MKAAWGVTLIVLWVVLLCVAVAGDDQTDRIVAAVLLVGLSLGSGLKELAGRFERYVEREQERHEALIQSLRRDR